jgi:hypothetical protein
MSIDDTTIRDLIGFSDPQGVLSIYLETTASMMSDPQPTAPLEIRDRISKLTDDVGDRDPDLARAITERLERNEQDLARLLDPRAHGRGRALFLGVQTGRTATVSVQLPFRHRVVHHDSPYIRPLVAAYDEGRDAGVLVVSRSGTRLLRWSVGEAEEVDSDRFVVFAEQVGRDMSGPSPANPADPRHGNVQRQRFEERLDANRQRFLRDAVNKVVQHATSQHWDRLVLSGAPKIRSAVSDLLPDDNDLRVITAEQSWEDAAPHEIAQQVWPLLRSVHEQRERQLVASARDRALSGGAGALGVREVCEALNEGRVAHLLYDDSLSLQGFRSDEGTVHPDVPDVMKQADIAVHPEPLLIERMIERAIATDAGVTPIGPDVAPDLHEHEGMAAILRW